MIVAVLADIHSNNHALTAILNDAARLGARESWFLGDLVGYGPYPFQSWLLLQQHKVCRLTWQIPGNHDWKLIGRFEEALFQLSDGSLFSPGWRASAIESQRRNAEALAGPDGERVRGWLGQLPSIASPRSGVYLVHGAFELENPAECLRRYVTSADRAEQSWQSLRRWLVAGAAGPAGFFFRADGHPLDLPRLMLFGHWHKQLVWRRSAASGSWEQLTPGLGVYPDGHSDPAPDLFEVGLRGPIASEPRWIEPLWDEDLEQPTVVNPGSVGQPRDGARAGEWGGQKWCWAKYALLDWSRPRGRICFRQVPYAVDPVLKGLENYPAELTDSLTKR